MTGFVPEDDRDVHTATRTADTPDEEAPAAPTATTDEPAGTDPEEPAETTPDEQGADEESTTDPEPRLPRKLTFRVTRTSLMAVAVVTVCISPAAASLPWLSILFVFPLALLVWVLRVSTVVDGTGVTARNITGTTRLNWDDMHGLRLDERSWVRAVTHSGEEVRLPSVRVRDLPRLAVMSRGRLDNPEAPLPADD